MSARGGVCQGGGCLPGGVGVCQGGCLPGGGVCQGGVGVPCDLSHHAFDVTCLLPPHQLKHHNSAPAYILLPGHVTCKACWDTHPPPLVDRHTPVNLLPCPKLRLRAVKIGL